MLVALAATLTGCDNPKKTVVPSDISTWESNQDFKAAVAKLPEDEKKLLAAYAIRAGLSQAFGGNGMPEGTTIGSAIEQQKAWQEEKAKEQARQQALADEIKQKKLEALKAMNEALTVTMLTFEFREGNPRAQQYSDYFNVKIGFKNNTSETIKGAKGVFVIKDMFGDELKRVNLSNDQGIPAGETSTISGSIDFNQFIDGDKKLKATPFDKLDFEWGPELYIFENGTRLEMSK